MTESGEDYAPSPCAAVGLVVNANNESNFSLPLIERPDDHENWFYAIPGGNNNQFQYHESKLKVMAFEDGYDIEAILISGGIVLTEAEFIHTDISKP